MDNWLKMIVAAACLVVVAGGFLYALGTYSESAAQSQSVATKECDAEISGLLYERQRGYRNKEFSDFLLANVNKCVNDLDHLIYGEYQRNRLNKMGIEITD